MTRKIIIEITEPSKVLIPGQKPGKPTMKVYEEGTFDIMEAIHATHGALGYYLRHLDQMGDALAAEAAVGHMKTVMAG